MISRRDTYSPLMERLSMKRAHLMAALFLAWGWTFVTAAPSEIDAICSTATETCNGFSAQELCMAWRRSLFDDQRQASPAPSLLDIFPSAAINHRRRGLKEASKPTENVTENLATNYIVRPEPGLGCLLGAYQGVVPGWSPTVQLQILAISPFATQLGADDYSCKFRYPTDFVPVPSGAQPGLAAKNLTFPGSFEAIKDRIRCEFSSYTESDPNLPDGVSGENYGSVTWYLNTPSPDALSITQCNGTQNLFASCTANETVTPPSSGFNGRRHLLQECLEFGSCQPTMVTEGTMANDGEHDVCFPGWAKVRTPQGSKPLTEVQVGDQVLALDAAGKPFYDTVYLLPHSDPQADGFYLTLHVEAVDGQLSAQVTLSPDHYMLVGCDDDSSRRCHREAGDVVVGDFVWLVDEAEGRPYTASVRQITQSVEVGAFSPLTLSGTLVVDGVLASVHAKWDPWEGAVLYMLPEPLQPSTTELATFKHWVHFPLRSMYRVTHAMFGPLRRMAHHPYNYINYLITLFIHRYTCPGCAPVA